MFFLTVSHLQSPGTLTDAELNQTMGYNYYFLITMLTIVFMNKLVLVLDSDL